MSQNMSIKINLRQLKSHVMKMKAKDGMIDCLILPIAGNSLYVGEKGIYLDLQGYEIKEKKADRKQTHIIKQSFLPEVYGAMTEEEKRALPIIGDAILWGGFTEPDPNDFPVELPVYESPVKSHNLPPSEMAMSGKQQPEDDSDGLPF